VTDGEPVVFRDFLTELLATQGVTVPDKSVPTGAARVAAAASERIWRLLKRPGSPPLTRFAVWVSSQECTIDISRAERELGYRPVISREEGLAELSRS
jgi:nucleoside-diphosphate-sugar epimerase